MAPAPLVWTTGKGVYCWVEHGIGWTLSERTRVWVLLVEVELVSGRTLTASEKAALVLTYGRPLP